MGASGTATIDFGSFPGAPQASTFLLGVTGLQSSSLVEAWLFPGVTPEHTEEEHMLDSFFVAAWAIIPDTGAGGAFLITCTAPTGTGNRYGRFRLGWVWA